MLRECTLAGKGLKKKRTWSLYKSMMVLVNPMGFRLRKYVALCGRPTAMLAQSQAKSSTTHPVCRAMYPQFRGHALIPMPAHGQRLGWADLTTGQQTSLKLFPMERRGPQHPLPRFAVSAENHPQHHTPARDTHLHCFPRGEPSWNGRGTLLREKADLLSSLA